MATAPRYAAFEPGASRRTDVIVTVRAAGVLHARLGFVEVGRAGSYLGEPFAGGAGVLMRCDPPAR